MLPSKKSVQKFRKLNGPLELYKEQTRQPLGI